MEGDDARDAARYGLVSGVRYAAFCAVLPNRSARSGISALKPLGFLSPKTKGPGI
jgi:hypothetical protein